ncbi:hypothetical protein BDR03DRAFT_969050 [Suillus americanus]|nr:hypothetical protein BDR03DRAFT_969050 [Suillus americanus]
MLPLSILSSSLQSMVPLSRMSGILITLRMARSAWMNLNVTHMLALLQNLGYTADSGYISTAPLPTCFRKSGSYSSRGSK